MGFELTKLLGEMIMPVPVILILLISGIALLLTARGKGIALVFLTAGPTCYFWSPQRHFPKGFNGFRKPIPSPGSSPDADLIVVLGGGSMGPLR